MIDGTTPLVLIDFDGVINQFPDDKVRRRGNSTAWMKPDDPRIGLYGPDNWFIPDHKEKVVTGRRGLWTITWSSELVSRIDALGAEVLWLSTWQPYTELLNMHLGVDWHTITWYDPVTGAGRTTGKRRAVLNHLRADRPLVWIDDEETTYGAGLVIQSSGPRMPVLGIGPDSSIGISRPQMDLIERFAAAPPAEPSVRFEVTSNGHDGHWGF